MTASGRESREKPTVRADLIAAVMASFLVFAVVAAFGLFFFYQSLAHNAAYISVNVFPSPRLETHNDGLRDPEIAKQQANLHRFRWIDRAHGVFQMPIERAMRLVAGRGDRAYDPVPAVSAAAGENPVAKGGAPTR
jgi:hypothetical protein